MSKQSIQLGDVVQLRSGGPLMTVHKIITQEDVEKWKSTPGMPDLEEGSIECLYFNAEGKREFAIFFDYELKKVEGKLSQGLSN